MVAMRRLSMNMITFAVGSVPILIVCIVALANLRELSSLGEGCKSPCKTFLYSYLFIDVEMLASVAAIVWLIAMIVDPVINILADKKLRGVFLRQFPSVFRSLPTIFRKSKEKLTETTVLPEKDEQEGEEDLEVERF
ncbi:hypothetical protein GCK72_009918 [Caenorhabditis remanei]|uniref:G-protein coupled receptors family 1 profile domain-containing protein n=1 Tax=Caenorhabditis remanei TaxID=31234 RepID=A0A6A5H5D4_CAERE|nr:hypothetical protein GCK72_009918 [Caenorhabditis remanei]KAF1761662.1 hypothetical protein GCK72_009918 [Caenorhabditis remanei]